MYIKGGLVMYGIEINNVTQSLVNELIERGECFYVYQKDNTNPNQSSVLSATCGDDLADEFWAGYKQYTKPTRHAKEPK